MFSKKRRADLEDDDSYRDFRPRMPKRQRIPAVVQLCKEMMPDIRTIGESIKAFEEDIKFLSEAIINEYGHEDYFNDALLSTFRAVVLEQPHKQPAIALLTMVVNTGNEVAAKSVINFFFEELQKCCDASIDEDYCVTSNETGNWNKFKLILRFLSLMSPIIALDDLLTVYQKVFQLAIDLNRDAGSECRNALSEALYTNTLLDLPYLFFFSRSDNSILQSKVEELFNFVEQEYQVKNSKFDLLKRFNGREPYQTTELIQVVLPNVKKALANNMEQLFQLFPDWQHLLTPTTDTSRHGFNEQLKLPSLEQVRPFSSLDKNNTGSVDNMWKEPRYTFHVYLPNSSVGDFETVLPITSYAGQLFKDIIIDIVESLEFNRKEVAKQVIMLDLFFKPNIFAEPGESIGQLAATYEENPLASTFKIEDITIETILELVFKLPHVSQPFAYFYTLLVEICQNSPKAIAPVFGRAFRFFYNNLENLDLELKLRYLDWFSIQMSNFNFSWKWNEWENDSVRFGSAFYNAKINFAKNLIRRELRLTSNTLDVEDSLPGEFKKYLDSSYVPRDQLVQYYQSFFVNEKFQINPDEIKKNDLYFRQESFPGHGQVRQLLDYMHKPNESRELSELETIINSIRQDYGEIINDFDKFSIVLLVQTVVHSGSRSLSHANKYINDLKKDLSHIFDQLQMDESTKQFTIVEAVLRFWNSNSQNGFLIVDAFKFADLLSPLSIFEFSFNEDTAIAKNYGLVDATSIESTFRNLSQHLDNQECFLFVFERLGHITNECVIQLGYQHEEIINIINTDDLRDEELPNYLPKLNLQWKYEATMSFFKSILRKYVDEYRALDEKLRNFVTATILHIPTKQQLFLWIDETHKL